MKAAILRLLRVLLAQIISASIISFAGVNVPIINISVGALINAIAKYLRDTYKWEWLPV